LVVRIVSALQFVGMAIIAAIAHTTLARSAEIRSRNFQPVLLEKTLCISNTVEHFARQSTRIARISDAIKARPEIVHSLLVVVELNFDRPWFNACKILPDCARYTSFQKTTVRQFYTSCGIS
jgi:hypothetical protein